MAATRATFLRTAVRHQSVVLTGLKNPLPLHTTPAFQKVQRACYAIPPQDKEDDDLGGPYGQESPNPETRKATNRSSAGRAAMVIGLGLGIAALASTFMTPRQIAYHQIEKDTAIGAPKSNPGANLAKVKRPDGVKTAHELHQEQTQG